MGIYVIIGIPLIGLLFAMLIHGSNSLEDLRLNWNEVQTFEKNAYSKLQKQLLKIKADSRIQH